MIARARGTSLPTTDGHDSFKGIRMMCNCLYLHNLRLEMVADVVANLSTILVGIPLATRREDYVEALERLYFTLIELRQMTYEPVDHTYCIQQAAPAIVPAVNANDEEVQPPLEYQMGG